MGPGVYPGYYKRVWLPVFKMILDAAEKYLVGPEWDAHRTHPYIASCNVPSSWGNYELYIFISCSFYFWSSVLILFIFCQTTVLGILILLSMNIECIALAMNLFVLTHSANIKGGGQA
jgi:hypothetical protein